MTLTIIEGGQQLILWGAAMFFIGLVQGVFIPVFRNSRMALSAHLTAVQCGMALLIFGVIWALIDLPALWRTATQYSAIAGFYLIWAGISLAAITGASKALPIAGEGFSANQFIERVVKAIELIGVALSLFAGTLVLVGLL